MKGKIAFSSLPFSPCRSFRMNLKKKKIYILAYIKTKYCMLVSVCWKMINVYLLFYPMSVPSLPPIYPNLPRLSYHWYFCSMNRFGLGCWWKPENSFVWGNKQNRRRIIFFRPNVFKHERNTWMGMLGEGEKQWFCPQRQYSKVLSFPHVL